MSFLNDFSYFNWLDSVFSLALLYSEEMLLIYAWSQDFIVFIMSLFTFYTICATSCPPSFYFFVLLFEHGLLFWLICIYIWIFCSKAALNSSLGSYFITYLPFIDSSYFFLNISLVRALWSFLLSTFSIF